ncbi:hypothetical protein BUZ91_13465 [Mammaliicoccus sciuri]|nr:hypothetical protein BS756_05360 [Staphylococcus sp. MB371]RIN97989.1 hypothetical protein BUZ91_13465 [Mammaliicoccus sciuri]
MELNLIDEDSIYIDGTKIEASAKKYTFVWRKNTGRYNNKVIERSKEIQWKFNYKNEFPLYFYFLELF